MNNQAFQNFTKHAPERTIGGKLITLSADQEAELSRRPSLLAQQSYLNNLAHLAAASENAHSPTTAPASGAVKLTVLRLVGLEGFVFDPQTKLISRP